MFIGTKPVQLTGFVQKRVRFTPKRLATNSKALAGSGTSSSSPAITWWKPVSSLRFHL